LTEALASDLDVTLMHILGIAPKWISLQLAAVFVNVQLVDFIEFYGLGKKCPI
jgi:hypothetical protein